MKAKSDELIEALAAEYVLGMLKGKARRRFERWMMESYKVRQEVWSWERQLNGLAEQVPAEQPSAQVWAGIEQRLWPQTQSSAQKQPKRTWLWQGWSLAATAAALLLALFIGLQPGAPAARWLAVVQSPEAQPLWVFNTDARHGQFQLKAVDATAPAADKDFELWILPQQGVPISVGLLPFNGARLTIDLNQDQLKQLLQSKTLAISLEPKGGSPTGQPTGPVLYKTQLLEL